MIYGATDLNIAVEYAKKGLSVYAAVIGTSSFY